MIERVRELKKWTSSKCSSTIDRKTNKFQILIIRFWTNAWAEKIILMLKLILQLWFSIVQ